METIVLERVVPSVFAADPKAVEGSEIWLREVTFRRGVRYLVEAASGAGKSSLCSFLYGIRDDYEGTIRFDATTAGVSRSGDGAISGAVRWDCFSRSCVSSRS